MKPTAPPKKTGLADDAANLQLDLKGVLRVYAFFFRFIRPYWKFFALSLLVMFIQIPAGQLSLFLVRDLTDQALLATDRTVDERMSLMIRIMLAQAAFWLLGDLMWKKREILGWYVMMRGTLDLRLHFYRHLHRLPMQFLRKRPPGEHFYRATSDMMSNHNKHDDPGLMGMIRWTVEPSLETIYTLLWASIFLYIIDPVLALLLIFYAVPFAAVAQWVIGKLRRAAMARAYGNATENAHLRDSIAGLRAIKSMGRTLYQRRRFATTAIRTRRAILWAEYWSLINGVMTWLVRWIFNSGIYIYITVRVLQGEATIGEWLATFALVESARQPIERFIAIFQSIRIWTVNGQRVLQTLTVEPDPVDEPEASDPGLLSGDLELRSVSLEYDEGIRALSEVSLKIRPGEQVGFVGPSGAGKSTVLYTILRLYSPTEGEILVDGKNLDGLKRDRYLAQVAYVPQMTMLFDGTVREAIQFGLREATDEQIWKALEEADVADVIRAKPEGLDYRVGDASTLSGGEKQRLGIARAVIREPKILVLDEATANLDPATEDQILKTLQKVSQGRTTLTVAHRLKAVQHCDRIVVMDGGAVVDQGSHEELLARPGWYRDRWQEQLADLTGAGSKEVQNE